MIRSAWSEGYIVGYTTKGDTVIEVHDGRVVVLLNGTAQFRDTTVNTKTKNNFPNKNISPPPYQIVSEGSNPYAKFKS